MLLKTSTRLMTTLATALFLSGTCLAETAETVHLGKSDVSKEQIIQLLAPEEQPKLLTRGLRLHNQPVEQNNFDGNEAPAPSSPKSLSLEIYFEFNSARLSPEAIEQLTPVGEALRSEELASLEFTLEGHTDASGDEYYNLKLSEQRAKSVKSFFVEQFQLAPERVRTEGKGESQLIADAPPTSGIHRRVTIIAQ